MTTCTIKMDEKTYESNDFAALIFCGEEPKLLYNADAITLGMAIQMLAIAYRESLDELSEEDRQMVVDELMIGDLENE